MQRNHGRNEQEAQNGPGFERSSSVIEMMRTDGYEELLGKNREYASEGKSKSIHDNLNNSYENNMMRNDMKHDDVNEEEHEGLDLYDNMQPMLGAVAQTTEDQHILMRTISNTDIASLDATLKRLNPRMDLTEIVNKENGYTLLHLAVFKDSDQIVYTLCKHIMEVQPDDIEIKKRKMKNWINKKSEGKEGFTAIHLAAFNGNLAIVRFLERHGADIHAENNFSLNALHVASQGNQPSTIIYFLNKNFDINSRDRVKSTPLHWACYAGAENAVSYLIAYGADPNLQDLDGYTPLHLSIKSAESIKSSRIVKQLLFWGADRNIVNLEGWKPIDLLKSISIGHIAMDIK